MGPVPILLKPSAARPGAEPDRPLPLLRFDQPRAREIAREVGASRPRGVGSMSEVVLE